MRAAAAIDIGPLWLAALPLAALFGLMLRWGIFWVYVGVVMEQVVKFGVGLRRLRSRLWINDVTRFAPGEAPPVEKSGIGK